MANKLNILFFITISISLSLSYYNDTSDDLQIVKLDYIGKAKVVINQTDLYIVTKAESSKLDVIHTLYVPKERKTLKNSIFYATSESLNNITSLDYKQYENLNVTEIDNMISYSGTMKIHKGYYGITLCRELIEGESIVVQTYLKELIL